MKEGQTSRLIAPLNSRRAQIWLVHPLLPPILALLNDIVEGRQPELSALDQLLLHSPASERSLLEAVAAVLLELRRWGGTLHLASDGLWLTHPVPTGRERSELKQKLLHERQRQLQQPAVQAFIRSMESMQLHRGRFFSIFSLMRAGESLATQLKDVMRGQLGLEQVIQPYIQVIQGDERCQDTGLLLRDIWRYFRHTWSLPYHSTPGRGLMVLIRDGATTPSAVIGIAMLSSAPAQLAVRDEWIGWGAGPLLKQLARHPEPAEAQALADWLEDRLEVGLSELYVQDFLEEGLLKPSDLHTPTHETLHMLRAAAARLRQCHRRVADSGLKETALRLTRQSGALFEQAWEDGASSRAPGSCSTLPEDAVLEAADDTAVLMTDWQQLARQPLYRWRRAELLAEYLRVKSFFRALAPLRLTGSQLSKLLVNEEGRHCVTFLARRLKAERMGTMLADISVCGAIAPYQALLGGKLVALLMLSAEVRAAYLSRYRSSPSVIASALAGRPIVRSAELVLLTTTALYGKHSSQYNRLRLPTRLPGGGLEAGPGFLPIGTSDGFGTLQFGDESMARLSRLVSQAGGGLKLTSLPGEGTSPRLRKVRAGLDLLGIEPEKLLRHGIQRGIFAVPLARNADAILQGKAEGPDYYASAAAGEAHTQALTRYWSERWLLPRLERPAALAEVTTNTLTWPVQHGARVSMPEEDKVNEQQDRQPETNRSAAT